MSANTGKQCDLCNLKAIVFDLDDTLFNSQLAYDNALKAIGIERGVGDASTQGNQLNAYLNARHLVKLRLGTDTSARNRLLYFKTMLELADEKEPNLRLPNYSPAAVLELLVRYEAALECEVRNQWEKTSSSRIPLLLELKKRYRLGILTNENTRTQLIKMRAIDPHAAVFPLLICSEDIGHEKPHAQAFRSMIDRLGVTPEQTLMVGDHWQNDIVGSISAGLFAVQTTEYVSEPINNINVFDSSLKLDHSRFLGKIGQFEDLKNLLNQSSV